MSNVNLVRMGAMALALSMTSAFAAPPETATMQVTASVAALCRLSLSGNMGFGALDVTVTSNATQSVTATYQCTKGTPVSSFQVGGITAVAAGGTYSGTMTGASATPDTIPYAIAWADPGAFTGLGMQAIAANQKTVTLNGTILNADYVNKKPDNYTHSVAVTVNY